MKLTPTQRLILLHLKIQPETTLADIITLVGNATDAHTAHAVRDLTRFGLLTRTGRGPSATFVVAETKKF